MEDHLLVANLVKMILGRAGEVEVDHVATLAAAQEKLRGPQKFDVVLADLSLPDSSGLETFRTLRAEAPAVPIVILTALADEVVALKAVAAGAQDYLLKGETDIRTLERSLRIAVERARGVRRLEGEAAEIRREGETRLRNIIDSLFAFVGVFSLEGIILDVNRAGLRAAGLRREQVVGRSLDELPWFSHASETAAQVLDGLRRAARGERLHLDASAVTGSGEVVDVAITFAPLRDAQGRIVQVVGSAVDITARRAAENNLRALTTRLNEVREEERQLLSREIHDRIGQVLTSLRLDLDYLERHLAPAAREPLEDRLTSMRALIQEAVETARRIAGELRPEILEDLGLAAAIDWQAREFGRRAGVACAVELPDPEPDVEPRRALALYRIFQEALTNVARHAGATHVWVRLETPPGEAILVVEDDGSGIRPEDIDRPSSLGLLGMRERARAVGGEVTFEGRSPHGTTVRARVPMPPPSAPAVSRMAP